MAKEVIFTPEDCEYVKTYYKIENSTELSQSLNTFINDKTPLSISRRGSSKYCTVSDKILLNFILNKVKKLGITNISSNAVTIAKYSVGDYFDKHVDFYKYGKGSNFKTLVIQLSDSNQYQGGDLVVKDTYQSRVLGSFSLFNSSDVHEVTKITQGERYSLTVFLRYQDFSFSSNLI